MSGKTHRIFHSWNRKEKNLCQDINSKMDQKTCGTSVKLKLIDEDIKYLNLC